MSTTPLRYALIGTGMMGCEHLRFLGMLRAAGHPVSVDALVDPDQSMLTRASTLAEELGFKQVESFASQQDLDLARLDAVVIASPNFTHRAVLEPLIDADIAILAEKPLCTTVDDCEWLLAALSTRRSKRPFWTAMEYRYMPPAARLLERLAAGDVGHIHMVSIREHRYPFLDKVGHWNRHNVHTGGTLVEKCCHHFDLMRLICGAEPTRLYASGGMDVNHLDETVNGKPADIIDNALVVVDFDNGVRASLDLCMFAEGSDPQEQITVIGDAGRLDAFIPAPDRFRQSGCDPHGRVEFTPRDGRAKQVDAAVVDETLADAGDHHGSTYHQHERFLAALCGDGAVEVTALDGALAVAMGACAQASIAARQAMPFTAPQGADNCQERQAS
jgi:predicted dehydrogenase